jgi:hypothetical protein
MKPDELTKLSALSTLNTLINRLQAWAQKPDAKPELIQQREQELANLVNYINQCIEYFENEGKTTEHLKRKIKWLQHENQSLKNIMNISGITAGDIPHFSKDHKEIKRSLSINRAHSVWADHFDKWTPDRK